MNRFRGGKSIPFILAGVVSLVAIFLVFVPKEAHAATIKWVNRYYITVDNVNYFDNDPSDDKHQYVQQGDRTCRSKILFKRDDPGGGFSNLAFFFKDSHYNIYTKQLIPSNENVDRLGHTTCIEGQPQNITVDDTPARRIAFYRIGDKITHIGSLVTFSKIVPNDNFRGSERFFRDDERSDTHNACVDMILLHPADVATEGDTVFGNGPVAGSAMLFPVSDNDALEQKSEMYPVDAELTGVGPDRCRIRSESLNKSTNGEFSMYSGSNDADVFVLSAGLTGVGAYNNADPTDAIISFVGGVENAPKGPNGVIINTPADPSTSNPGETINDRVCRGGGLGWIVCPIASAIQTATDTLTAGMQIFLVVNPLPVGDNALYKAWNNVRNLANIAFVLGFFIIILSQATSIGITNYGIKRLLPRLIIVVIATNISYFLCSFMVDVFNVLGAGITNLFALANNGEAGALDLRGGVGDAASGLFGGGLVALIVAAFTTGAIVEVIPFITAGFLALILIFVILIIRQSLIVLLVVFSPFAFLAALLPGTERWFSRWMNLFIGMLVMYPLTMALFAGARLASSILSAVGGG